VSAYYTRLAATLTAVAVLGAVIAKPDAGRKAAARLADSSSRMPTAERACAPGEAPLKGPFAPVADVLSLSPLGAIAAPGEPAAPPDLRLTTRLQDGRPRETAALAPARAEIALIEQRIDPDTDEAYWRVRMKPCGRIAVVYDRLDSIDPAVLRRAGGPGALAPVGAGRSAAAVRVKVRQGDVIGRADGFDIALQDLAAPPAAFATLGRYAEHPDAAALDERAHSRCALDYLDRGLRAEWAAKLGDARGVRLARADNACRVALPRGGDSAQGAWFTDSSHNALASKVSAIALAPDAIDPTRLVFSLHGRLASLTPDLVAGGPGEASARRAARDFLTFERGHGRINAAFDQVRENETYCYEGLRANFAGPALDGVILLRIDRAGDATPLMKIEARGEPSCIDLAEPWSFSGRETSFYR
jgi:hypothetical protein